LFLGTLISNPDRLVERDVRLDLKGVTAERVLAPGHTTASLGVWIPEDRVLYAGDTVVSDYRPNLASGRAPDWHRWLASLDRFEALGAEIVVPGHGRILRGREINDDVARIRTRLRIALGEGEPPCR